MQFTTKLGIVDIPNAEVLAAAESISGDVIGQLQRRINELNSIRQRVVDERDEAKALTSERESRLTNIKLLLEPIYGSTNYAPIGGTLDRVLNICDLP